MIGSPPKFQVYVKNSRLYAGCAFSRRGQASLETAFVFSMLIFLVFAIVNFAIIFHTKNVATYAAFMAARSYQVMGDQDRTQDFDVEEVTAKGKPGTSFLKNLKGPAPYLVAEDIFTCALPWVTVPSGDGDALTSATDILTNTSSRCMEGKRKYKNFNVGDSLRFQPFGDANDPVAAITGGSGKNQLSVVDKGFKEAGRDPLQYGILSMQFKKTILFNPFGLFSARTGESALYVDQVFVPVLLNPGLKSKFSKEKSAKKFDADKVAASAATVIK